MIPNCSERQTTKTKARRNAVGKPNQHTQNGFMVHFFLIENSDWKNPSESHIYVFHSFNTSHHHNGKSQTDEFAYEIKIQNSGC